MNVQPGGCWPISEELTLSKSCRINLHRRDLLSWQLVTWQSCPPKSSKTTKITPQKSSKPTKLTPQNPAKPPKPPLQIQQNHQNQPPKSSKTTKIIPQIQQNHQQHLPNPAKPPKSPPKSTKTTKTRRTIVTQPTVKIANPPCKIWQQLTFMCESLDVTIATSRAAAAVGY